MVTSDEEEFFLRMEKELADYNDALGRGEKVKEPQYDDDLFLRFRRWQGKGLAEKGRRLGGAAGIRPEKGVVYGVEPVGAWKFVASSG